MDEHSMGSLRSLLHAAIVKKMVEFAHEIADIQDSKEARDAVARMEAKDVEIHVYKLEAKSGTPKEEKPWVFQIKLAEGEDSTYRTHLNLIVPHINKELKLARHQPRDESWQRHGMAGQIARGMAKTKGKGKGTKKGEVATDRKRKN